MTIGAGEDLADEEASVYVGNLDPTVQYEDLVELFRQAGEINNLQISKDWETKWPLGYGFIEFKSKACVEEAIELLHMFKLNGKHLWVRKASHEKKSQEVGAEVYVGNLHPDVDEEVLYHKFCTFGEIICIPKIIRDHGTKKSRGFGFIKYDSVESSKKAIEAMDGQCLFNQNINVAIINDKREPWHCRTSERI